jgi:hypothetical protein
VIDEATFIALTLNGHQAIQTTGGVGKSGELSIGIDERDELYIIPLLFIHTGMFKCAN